MHAESLFFLKKFVRSMRSVGAVTPASHGLSAVIAQVARAQPEALQIIELGAGTGRLTHALIGAGPTLVEIDAEFCAVLRQKFPKLAVLNQCATHYLNDCQADVGVIVSIPLSTSPKKAELIQALERLKAKGHLKWCVLYTYLPWNPLRAIRFDRATLCHRVWKNAPPAFVWLYR